MLYYVLCVVSRKKYVAPLAMKRLIYRRIYLESVDANYGFNLSCPFKI